MYPISSWCGLKKLALNFVSNKQLVWTEEARSKAGRFPYKWPLFLSHTIKAEIYVQILWKSVERLRFVSRVGGTAAHRIRRACKAVPTSLQTHYMSITKTRYLEPSWLRRSEVDLLPRRVGVEFFFLVFGLFPLSEIDPLFHTQLLDLNVASTGGKNGRRWGTFEKKQWYYGNCREK